MLGRCVRRCAKLPCSLLVLVCWVWWVWRRCPCVMFLFFGVCFIGFGALWCLVLGGFLVSALLLLLTYCRCIHPLAFYFIFFFCCGRSLFFCLPLMRVFLFCLPLYSSWGWSPARPVGSSFIYCGIKLHERSLLNDCNEVVNSKNIMSCNQNLQSLYEKCGAHISFLFNRVS